MGWEGPRGTPQADFAALASQYWPLLSTEPPAASTQYSLVSERSDGGGSLRRMARPTAPLKPIGRGAGRGMYEPTAQRAREEGRRRAVVSAALQSNAGAAVLPADRGLGDNGQTAVLEVGRGRAGAAPRACPLCGG